MEIPMEIDEDGGDGTLQCSTILFMKKQSRKEEDDPLIIEEMPSDDEWVANPNDDEDDDGNDVPIEVEDAGPSSSSRKRKSIQVDLDDEDDSDYSYDCGALFYDFNTLILDCLLLDMNYVEIYFFTASGLTPRTASRLTPRLIQGKRLASCLRTLKPWICGGLKRGSISPSN
ncbi:hypothetical protein L6452_22438 [Arctium lappa]|uniref:Uncharacterized protein n=1 Tax=Arctium lappa TaxID=4217 RepID=A0ACB9B0G0_ARCLA|nr:hypothetical protein L6452_22438 [Arctium lappa]